MIENRPDWVLSRQPHGCATDSFTHQQSGKILRDEAVNQRIVEAVKAQGADAWFNTDPQALVTYQAED